MGPCTALPMSAALCICLSMLLTWAAGVTAAQTVSSEAFSTLLKDQQAAAIESHTATDLHSRECAVKPPNATLLAQAQVQTAQKAEQLKNDVRTESSALILINVYAHVISQGPALTDGNVPDSWVKAQVTTLNRAYVATGFQFALVNVSRTINAAWYNMAPQTSTEITAKTQLRSGNNRDLNMYFTSGGGNGLLGWSYYAFERATLIDGVTVYWNAMPGGTAGGGQYGLGMSAVHETGHWLGLLHTFQGGCSSPGDYVSDTAPEAIASFGCAARDSCPGDGLADPINNYLDYSPDACMNTFTPGQAARMLLMWQTYRATFPVLPTGPKLSDASTGVATPVTAAAPSTATRRPPPPVKRPTPKKPQPSSKRPVPRPTPAVAAPNPVTPAPVPTSLTVSLAQYAQCGGIAGSPICAPTCDDAMWAGVKCSVGSCKRSNIWVLAGRDHSSSKHELKVTVPKSPNPFPVLCWQIDP